MKFMKASIIEANGKTIFDSDYGISSMSIRDVIFVVGDGNEMSYNQIYKAKGDQFVSLCTSSNNILDILETEKWDSSTYYIKDKEKANKSGYYWYGNNGNLAKGLEKAVKIRSIKIDFRLEYYNSSSYYGNANRIVEFKRKKDYLDYKLLIIEKWDRSMLIRPFFKEIEEGDSYYYIGHGEVKVVKLYKFPNKGNLVCKIEANDGKSFDINYSCTDLYYLPYEKNLNEKTTNNLAILDENLNELELQPYLIRENQTFNIYWKGIDDAVDYIVSLYKIIEYNGRKDLYHLNDYTVERNEKFFSISGLIGHTFVFKVSAEDRSGKKIAISRGIVNGLPDNFMKEN